MLNLAQLLPQCSAIWRYICDNQIKDTTINPYQCTSVCFLLVRMQPYGTCPQGRVWTWVVAPLPSTGQLMGVPKFYHHWPTKKTYRLLLDAPDRLNAFTRGLPAPGFQTGPIWQLIWKLLLYTKIGEVCFWKQNGWEISHAGAESLLILDQHS